MNMMSGHFAPTPKGWTPQRIADLRRMWAEGRPAALIGQAIGMSRNAVIGKAHRLGLEPHPKRNQRRTGRPKKRKVRVQRPKRPPVTVVARKRVVPVPRLFVAEYEAMRRADGALPFIDAPSIGRCKMLLAGESGMHGLQCAALIPVCASWCEVHRSVVGR